MKLKKAAKKFVKLLAQQLEHPGGNFSSSINVRTSKRSTVLSPGLLNQFNHKCSKLHDEFLSTEFFQENSTRLLEITLQIPKPDPF